MIAPIQWAPPNTPQYFAASTYLQKYGLEPRDRLIEPIFLTGISKHHATYLGVDSSSEEWVAETHYLHVVRQVEASDFFLRCKNVTIDKFIGSPFQRAEAVERARSYIGRSYDLVAFNWEHYASYVQTGRAESMQVVAASFFLLLAFCLLLWTYQSGGQHGQV